MEAVAPGDEVAVEALLAPVLTVGHVRLRAVEAMHGDVRGLVDGPQSRAGARLHQVARDLGLAIDEHALATRQPGEIDAVPFIADEDLEAVVHEAFAMHARADAGFVQQIDGHLLEHARTDPAEHVFAGLPLEHDRIDAGPVQQLAEQQARRAGAYDGDWVRM